MASPITIRRQSRTLPRSSTAATSPENIDYSGPDLKPYLWDVDGTGKAVVGYAVTSTWMPLHGPSDDPNERSDLLDSIGRANAPTIVVQQDIDLPSRRGAIIGDEMAHQMNALGAVGAVVDGNARDIPGINRAGLSLWATGRVPGHARFSFIDHGIPVDVAGLRIWPGDILVCDGDGVTRISVDVAADVLKQCAEVRDGRARRSLTSRNRTSRYATGRTTRCTGAADDLNPLVFPFGHTHDAN